MHSRDKIRNIAIIAHVDHGKTTLVDKLLQQSGTFRENEAIQERAMDSNDLERERGITILAKNTAIQYKDYLINIVDTPGHADFGGEVERIMKMVDGVLLVVDAFEGCMPQTKFVLRKALEQNLKPIVVLNKIDRPNARPAEVVDEVLDLFIELGANDDQLDFQVVYASALQGISGNDPEQLGTDMHAVYEIIVNHIPSPTESVELPLQFLVTLMDYNEYMGRIGIGRVNRGVIRQGQSVAVMTRDGKMKQARIEKLFGFQGLKRIEIEEAGAGDIIAIAGIKDINIGETVADPANPEALPVLKIDEPTLQMTFLVNNSPFAGKEGKWVTSRKLRQRPHFQVGLFNDHLFIWLALIYELPNKVAIAEKYLKQVQTVQKTIPSDYVISQDHMKKDAVSVCDLNKTALIQLLTRFRDIKKAELLIGRKLLSDDPLVHKGDELILFIKDTFAALIPHYQMAVDPKTR